MPIKEVIGIWIEKDKRTYIATDSKGQTVRVTKAEDILDFLTVDYGQNTARICWNLYQLYGVICELLPREIVNKIDKEDRAWFKYNYKIFNSSGKVLSIGHIIHEKENFQHKVETNTYDLKKFFPDYAPKNLDDLMSKANELMNALTTLNWQTESLSSAIGIYEDAVLDKEYLPTIYSMPDTPEADELLEMCYKMMCREWRAIYKVGAFQNIFHGDLHGSYPSIIKDFYDTDDCIVWKANSFQKSDWGIVEGTINITSDYCPIVNKYGDTYVGKNTDVFTTEQIGFLYHYKQGTFKLDKGLFVNFNKEIKPFEELMNNLYIQRDMKGVFNTLAKGSSVGIYGRMSEEHPEKYGKLFHPLYSVLTTSRTSIKVAKFILDHHLEQGLISVIVDGFQSTIQPDYPGSKNFGDWEIQKVNTLALSVGHLYTESADGKNTKDANLNTYQSMIEAIKAHPNKSYYNEVLLHKNAAECHRHFRQYPKTGRQLLEKVWNSEPIIMT